MSFRRRNYPEVLDNLLTSLVGGVSAETHPYPPDGGGLAHQLQLPPVRQVVSVYGTRNGEPKVFRAGNDYQLGTDKQTLTWTGEAQAPDDGTLVHVNYLREDDVAGLNDLQVGSVLRTVSESVALEIARLYAQLEAVYKAGYIDTAAGSSLDKVVALLDVVRVRGARPTVNVQFKRAAGSVGAITIPAGTRVLDEQVRFEYATTETVTLAERQNQIQVVARDLEAANEPVAADTLTVLAVPIAGISGVTNPGPARRASADETDAELRTRAKNFLHGSERATLGALRQVLARQQVAGDVEEVEPGLIRITPHADDLNPQRLLQLETELEATRPAGVLLEVVAPIPPLSVELGLRLTTQAKAVTADLRAAHAQVREAVQEYFDKLETRADASLNQLVGRVLAVPLVEDMQIERAGTREGGALVDRLDRNAGIIDLAGQPTVLGELALADPNLPTEIEVLIGFPDSADIPVQAQIEAALGQGLAYLNDLASQDFDPTDAAAVARRTLSLGQFLRLLPLPGFPGTDLASWSPGVDTLPQLGERAPYMVTVLLHQSSGLTQILGDDPASYAMTPSERLLLSALTIAVEEGP